MTRAITLETIWDAGPAVGDGHVAHVRGSRARSGALGGPRAASAGVRGAAPSSEMTRAITLETIRDAGPAVYTVARRTPLVKLDPLTPNGRGDADPATRIHLKLERCRRSAFSRSAAPPTPYAR